MVEQTFENGSTNHDLSALVIPLLKGAIYQESDATLWHALLQLQARVRDYVAELREIIKLQRQNRAETEGGVAFGGLVKRQIDIRKRTTALSRSMEGDGVPIVTVVEALDRLVSGPMADVLRLLESGQSTERDALAAEARKTSLPVQDRIIWQEYLQTVVKERDEWKDLYRASKDSV